MSPRRIRLVVRVVLYGTLALIGFVLWSARPGEKLAIAGETSQGEHFDLQTFDDGGVHAFQTYVVTRCDEEGETREISWFPADGDPVPFERDGDALRVREEWHHEHEDGWSEDGWARLDGRVAGDGRSAAGVIDAETTFEHPAGRRITCRASRVRFRAAAN